VKEFVTAVQEAEAEADREAKIAALIEQGKTQAEAEQEVDGFIPFKIDGRELRAYPLLPGQLAFMMAALGRGQTADTRFAAIINIMMSSLRDDDQDYFESRLLTQDPKKLLPLEQVEEIFEFLAGEWFARPTQ